MVGAERDPNLLKRVVVIDGFPADIHEAEAGRSESRLYSATSPDRQFPDMVISLRCGREEALGRWLDRVPGDLWQLLPMFERWFDNQYRVYTESTTPLLDSYRDRGIPVHQVCFSFSYYLILLLILLKEMAN